MILREIKNMYIKNRLTEGVDFKRYEWLDSSKSKVWIPINENDFQSLIMYRIGNPNTEIISTTHPNYGTQAMFFNFESWLPGFAWYNPDTHYVAVNEQNLQFSLTKSGDNIIYEGNSTRTINYPMNKLLQVIVTNNMTRLKSITTSTGQYLPCKLLQDIPASLSINNKAYTADTCGLYYTTTGKFIGNSNFTVEGDVTPETHTGLQQIYQNKLIEGVDYETADWLKGDGNAYIDTKVTDLSTSDYIKTIFDDSGNIGVKIRTWGREKNRVVVGNNKSTTSITVWGSRTSFVYSNDGVYLYDMYFDLLNNKVTINNTIFNLSLPHNNGASFLLFAIRNSSNAVDYKNLAKYKSFEIHNQINLVPCTLLRSIPRNLDAQCKERVAGECGMIDLISGKFYGNVANSGTFTVENDNNE